MKDTVQSSGRPEIGAILANKYRITRVLAEGVTGVVFEAVNVRLGQRVAIKLAQPSVLTQPTAVERFARDVRAVARLRSRNSIRVIDVEVTDAGRPFLVMELLEGRDLRTELADRGPLAAAEALSYVRQACSAMVEAHNHGMVHGDLKPSNLFLAREPDGSRCIKVLNLGVFRMQTGTRPLAAETREATDPALYLAPEQVQASKVVDLRCDVWALGVILYELLSGRRPFEGSSAVSVDVAIVNRRPDPLNIARGELPSSLEDVVFKALEKRPEDRFSSAQALLAALTPIASNPAPAEPFRSAGNDAVGGVGQTEVGAVSHASPHELAHEAARPPRWRAVALLTPLLVLAPFVYVMRCNGPEHTADEPSVTSLGLALRPPAETRALPAENAETSQVGSANADATYTPDAAAPVQARSAESPVRGLSEPTPSGVDASPVPLGLSEPLRRHAPNARKGGPAPRRAGSAAAGRGLPTRSPNADPSPSTPPVRVWDEDSPVPP